MLVIQKLLKTSNIVYVRDTEDIEKRILLYVWVLVDIEDEWYCYIFDDTEDFEE